MIWDIAWVGVIVLLVLLVASAIRILREYERGVVFTLGRFWKVKGPGLVSSFPASSNWSRWTCAPWCSRCRPRT